MKLSELRPDDGSRRRKRRVGRGISAGQGKTAGRGTKGTGARRGGGKAAYFEGGQLPLVRRLPFKRGFTNVFRIEHQEVNLDALQKHFPQGGEVTPADLQAKGLIRDANEPIVILGRGEVNTKFTLHAHRISQSARTKIEAAGGSVQALEYLLTGAKATIKRPKKAEIEALRAAQAGQMATPKAPDAE
ncbi:MAG: 50S ribosomal protein L15 [Anaerolineae bacterium]|nr:50S ribosomal protein L15 [Anaerolineae bacterium]